MLSALDEEFDDPILAITETEGKVQSTLEVYQQEEIRLKTEFGDVISDVPGRTYVVEHVIDTAYATPIRLPALPIASHF